MDTQPQSIDDLLDARGWPLSRVAKRAKISMQTLLELRQGIAMRPRVQTIDRLATVLGVTPREVRAAYEVTRVAALAAAARAETLGGEA